jgi:hypothetical protein
LLDNWHKQMSCKLQQKNKGRVHLKSSLTLKMYLSKREVKNSIATVPYSYSVEEYCYVCDHEASPYC